MPKLLAASAEAVAAHQKKIAEVKNAMQRINEIAAARMALSWRIDRERTHLESALIDTADPEIDTFVAWLDDDIAITSKIPMDNSRTVTVHPVTGRKSVVSDGAELVTPAERVNELRKARTAAIALKLQPDQTTIADQLSALKAALPAVGALKDEK